MAKKKLSIYNDPVLHKKALAVKNISGTIRKLVEDMFETMYENDGVGLAAPQVGVSKRLFVIDTKEDGMRHAFINPKIISASTNAVESYNEGCLSLPNMDGDVIRPKVVTVQYQDIDGQEKTLVAEGLLARAIQHENDHLDGILFIERVRPAELRQKLLEKASKLEAQLLNA